LDYAQSTQDRVRGCIVGAIVGDAFGAPLEGALQTAIALLVARRVTTQAPWRYTDDGATVLATAEALALSGTIDPTVLLRSIERHYEPARGFGRGMKLALAAFASGTPWERCAFAAWPEGSRGNGGAVRIPAVAVAQWEGSAVFDLAVQLATRVTHAHPEALAFSRVQAIAIATILAAPGVVEQPAVFHRMLIERLRPMPTFVGAKLDAVFELIASGAGPETAARTIGTSTAAAESVPAALWSFVARHAAFTDAIASAALLGGDVDSICSLVGALAGALHGFTAIDPTWIANLADEQPMPAAIVELADAIFALKPTPPTGEADDTLGR